MKLSDYQNKALQIPHPIDVNFAALSLAEETGEVIAIIRRFAFRTGDRHNASKELADELGDVLWCVAAIASDFNLSLDEISKDSIAKMERRHLGKNRDRD
jgi:NTP pyrophosphatase (non-canonical NTP hydrolase)